MIELEDRLRSYHRALVEELGEQARALVPARTRTPRAHTARSRRTMGVVAAVAVVVAVATLATRAALDGGRGEVTLHVPGFTIVAHAATDVTPRLTADRAEALALRSLATTPGEPHVSGYTVTTATFAPGVVRVSQECGARIGMAQARNVWVIALTAPPQHGLTLIRAAVLVDDDRGTLAGGQILTTTRPATGPLATCHWGT